jgi:transcriptional accessory protein Tex/SPT6
MGSKWVVLRLLWSPSQNRYVQPGEVVELGDAIARKLLKIDVIKPAVKAGRKAKEKDHATNSQ